MKLNHRHGIILAIIGIFAGLLLFYLLSENYMIVVNGKNADGRPDEALAVMITYSMLGWFGISAASMWAAVLYGFIKKENWAWYVGTMAAALQMLAGFFPSIPAKSISLPAPTLTVFFIAVVLWFGMLLIGKVNRKVITLIFIAGLAYVLTYIDGVATISKYQTTTYNDFWKGMYIESQMVLWFGATAWYIFAFAVLKRKKWAVPLGIAASLSSMMGGYPLAVVNIMEVHRFSMFLPGPVIATGLLITLILPKTKALIENWEPTS
jgi:hypothetical protein